MLAVITSSVLVLPLVPHSSLPTHPPLPSGLPRGAGGLRPDPRRVGMGRGYVGRIRPIVTRRGTETDGCNPRNLLSSPFPPYGSFMARWSCPVPRHALTVPHATSSVLPYGSSLPRSERSEWRGMTRDDKTEEVRNGRDNMRHEPRNDGETNVGPYGSYLRSSRCSSRVLCPSPSTPRLRLGTKGTVR